MPASLSWCEQADIPHKKGKTSFLSRPKPQRGLLEQRHKQTEILRQSRTQGRTTEAHKSKRLCLIYGSLYPRVLYRPQLPPGAQFGPLRLISDMPRMLFPGRGFPPTPRCPPAAILCVRVVPLATFALESPKIVEKNRPTRLMKAQNRSMR
jgi:hypothetical protein